MSATPDNPYASRGGLKLRHALDAFSLDVTGLACADLGCSTGGFTDCLLKAGAARVTAIDTGYGVLAWALRNDPRVSVRERTNALHAKPASEAERADVVVFDLGWTPQKLAVPAALGWLRDSADARIIALIKPHYEDKALAGEHRGILPDDVADAVAARVMAEMTGLGVRVLASTASPIRGSSGKTKSHGNREWLALLARSGARSRQDLRRPGDEVD